MKRTMTSVCIASSILVGISANAIAADYEWDSNFYLVEIIKDMLKNRDFRKNAPGKSIDIKEFDLAAMDRNTFANGGPLIIQSTADYGRQMIAQCTIRDEAIAAREAQDQRSRNVHVYGTIASVGDNGLVIDPCFVK